MHFVSFWSFVGLASVAKSCLLLSLGLLALAPLALAQSTPTVNSTVAVPTGTANRITLLTNARHPPVANYSTTTYTDPRTGKNHTITYTLSSTNNVIYQDDINWGPLSLLQEWSSNYNPGPPSKRGFGVVTARAWPDATVVYRYDSFETRQLLQGIVDSAIEEWRKGDPFLTFKELAPSPYDEDAKSILTITKHDLGTYWCWANAAWDRGNTGLRMNLQWLNADSTSSCGQDINVAVHELGHVLGLMHEHMRPDRASHVKIDCTKYSPWTIANCPPDPKCCPGDPFDRCCADLGQFDLESNPIYTKYGSYDCESTMHYPSSLLLQGLPGCNIAPSSLPTQGDFDAVCQIYQAQCMPWKFAPVYAQGDPGRGIGGYDLKSARDRIFALDYDSSGKLDHLALYRPGTGTCWILRKATNGKWNPVYRQGDPGNGIGGYDLKHRNDVGFAFDYESSGKLDHIVFYRPGFGAIFIMKKQGNKYTPVYSQAHGGSGIGGYDLKSPEDRMFAFDYNHSGRMDHLAVYRPGTGTFWILRKATNGKWNPVYRQGDPGKGIGGYDLRSKADRAFAFDWDSSGKMDHIALYRPGRGTFWVLRNNGGTFSPVMAVGDPGNGIGGYDLASPADVAMAYDWDHSGKNDHVALYRPGTGTLWVLERLQSGGFKSVYAEGDPGKGVGGYDMKSPRDKLLAFDYESSGRSDYLVAYRTSGSGTVWILEHRR